MTNQTIIPQKTMMIISIAIFASVFASALFGYLSEKKRSDNAYLMEQERSRIEEKRIAVEDKLADIERERITAERENVKLNFTSTAKVTIDKMTNCMKTMMEESRKDRSIPISAEKAKELCKDLQK